MCYRQVLFQLHRQSPMPIQLHLHTMTVTYPHTKPTWPHSPKPYHFLLRQRRAAGEKIDKGSHPQGRKGGITTALKRNHNKAAVISNIYILILQLTKTKMCTLGNQGVKKTFSYLIIILFLLVDLIARCVWKLVRF